MSPTPSMRSRTIVFLIFILGFTLIGCQGEGVAQNATGDSIEGLETDEQKMLYVLGMLLGGQLTDADLTEAELEAVFLGMADSAQEIDSRVDIDEYGPRMQEFMQAKVSARANQEGLESAAFIEQQAAMAGATRTDSGIVITEIEAGGGESPTAADTVMVHYHGTLRDGTVFDSSVEREEPATFPLGNVIPCWTEGVQTIQVGGKSRLVCPANLAYGSNPPPGSGIPQNAALIFEVELLEIVDTGTQD